MKCEFKYAPQQLNDVIYPSTAVEARIKSYATGALSDSLILYGPNGTGKSTVARLLIEAIGGAFPSVETKSYEDLVRLNDMRGYLRQTTSTARLTTSGKHFLLLEEFDNETKKMETLWAAMDACGDGLMAIITTNNLMKIHKSLRSRMTTIEFPALTPVSVLPRAQKILQAEGVQLPDDQVLHYLTTMAVPQDLRKYMRVLDQILVLYPQGLLPNWQPVKPGKPKLSIVP